MPQKLIEHAPSCYKVAIAEQPVMAHHNPCCFSGGTADIKSTSGQVTCEIYSGLAGGSCDCFTNLTDNDVWIVNAPCEGHSSANWHRWGDPVAWVNHEKPELWYKAMAQGDHPRDCCWSIEGGDSLWPCILGPLLSDMCVFYGRVSMAQGPHGCLMARSAGEAASLLLVTGEKGCCDICPDGLVQVYIENPR